VNLFVFTAAFMQLLLLTYLESPWKM